MWIAPPASARARLIVSLDDVAAAHHQPRRRVRAASSSRSRRHSQQEGHPVRARAAAARSSRSSSTKAGPAPRARRGGGERGLVVHAQVAGEQDQRAAHPDALARCAVPALPPRARAAAPRRRTAARSPNGSAPDGSVTTVAVRRPSTSGRATLVSTGVTSPSHSAESHGVMNGTGSFGRGRIPIAQRHAVEHLAVGEHVRPADLDLAPSEAATSGARREVLDDVVDRDRLGVGAQPARRDHHGQPAARDSEACGRTRCGAHHHRGAEVGQRRSLGGERQGGLVAALQMLGDRLVAEPAEVDDPLDALRAARLAAKLRAPSCSRCSKPAPPAIACTR